MDLEEFMKKEKMTLQKAADDLGTTKAAVCRYRLGTRMPNALMIRKIVAWSKGEITAKDIIWRVQ